MQRRCAIIFITAALLLGACGSSSSTSWKHLRSVKVTVSQPSIENNVPATVAFTSPVGVARATAALNAHHIRKLSMSSSNPACAGGSIVSITIVQQPTKTIDLTALRCGGQTTGDVGGDLPGFLGALGLPRT